MKYIDKLKNPKWQKKPGIYKLIVGENIYIGSAVDLPKRIRAHYNLLESNKHSNIYLQRAFNKYVVFDFDVIEIVQDKNNLIIREQFFIDTLKPKYNISTIAGSQLGFKHSEETKRKISLMQIGKVISPETRERMRQSKIGWSPTAEQRKNYSLSKMGDKNPFYKAGKKHPQYGTHRSPETIKKLFKDNNRLSKSGVLYDVDTGANYIFRSLKSMCGNLSLPYRGVLSALRHERFYKNRYYANFIPVPKGCETIIGKK